MSINKPWLFLPPKVAHDLSPFFLNLIAKIPCTQNFEWKSFDWRGLYFKNPLGIAGGVDKNVDQVIAWSKLGSGFIEVGTITPLPQGPNPGKIMDRDLNTQSVWNKMGFPNNGLDKAIKQLEKLNGSCQEPIFANIGKNRNTTNESSAEDYKKCIVELENLVDGFVINISSPNTKNLRELLKPTVLKPFLEDVLAARSNKLPTLLKLSPDLSDDVLFAILDTSVEAGIDGWIFTNTTLARPLGISYPKEGGLSGEPLAEASETILKKSLNHLGHRRKGRLVISTGGIMTVDDVKKRLDLGADLVQVYAALVFNGPYFFKNILKKLNSD